MKRRYYLILAQLTLIVLIFAFSLSEPSQDNRVKDFFAATGYAVKVVDSGCVKNYLPGDSIIRVIEERIDYSQKYNLVAIRSEGDYYILSLDEGRFVDSYGRYYELMDGDIICYDFSRLPSYIEVAG